MARLSCLVLLGLIVAPGVAEAVMYYGPNADGYIWECDQSVAPPTQPVLDAAGCRRLTIAEYRARVPTVQPAPSLSGPLLEGLGRALQDSTDYATGRKPTCTSPTGYGVGC